MRTDLDLVTSECFDMGRCWNCSGYVRYFFRPWKKLCVCHCPCHWSDDGNTTEAQDA